MELKRKAAAERAMASGSNKATRLATGETGRNEDALKSKGKTLKPFKTLSQIVCYSLFNIFSYNICVFYTIYKVFEAFGQTERLTMKDLASFCR
jgi:hypothetical protein